jgi:L-fucose isomerase-like protein
VEFRKPQFRHLAVSDWAAFQANPGMHPGSAFSWLEEVDHIPVASEGDVLGALTQLLARALSGRLGCLLDITEPDLDTGTPADVVWRWSALYGR